MTEEPLSIGGKPDIEETTPSVVGWTLELQATPAAVDWNLNREATSLLCSEGRTAVDGREAGHRGDYTVGGELEARTRSYGTGSSEATFFAPGTLRREGQDF